MEPGKNFKENNLRIIQNYFGSTTPEKLHIDNVTYDGDDHQITYTEIDIPGDSLLEQMDYMEAHMDHIRVQLMGDDPTNCIDLIVPPKIRARLPVTSSWKPWVTLHFPVPTP